MNVVWDSGSSPPSVREHPHFTNSWKNWIPVIGVWEITMWFNQRMEEELVSVRDVFLTMVLSSEDSWKAPHLCITMLCRSFLWSIAKHQKTWVHNIQTHPLIRDCDTVSPPRIIQAHGGLMKFWFEQQQLVPPVCLADECPTHKRATNGSLWLCCPWRLHLEWSLGSRQLANKAVGCTRAERLWNERCPSGNFVQLFWVGIMLDPGDVLFTSNREFDNRLYKCQEPYGDDSIYS